MVAETEIEEAERVAWEDQEVREAEVSAVRAEWDAATLDRNRMVLEENQYGTETLHFDEGENTFTIERVQDVEPILDWCKGRFNEGIANRHCEFRQIASLPPGALDVWARANGYGLPDGWYLQKQYHHLVMRAAHDSDLSGFRTLHGDFRRRGEG